MLWFVKLRLPREYSAEVEISFTGVLFPWLLSLGCTQVWQAHTVVGLEGT